MEKEEIRSEAPFKVSGITLVPLSKSLINCREVRRRLFATGAVKPFGIVVFSEKEKRVLLVEGGEISLEQLYEKAPGVKEHLEAI